MIKIVIIAYFCCLHYFVFAEPVIVLFITPYPTCKDPQKTVEKLSRVGKLPKHTLRATCALPSNTGVLASYAGFFAFSTDAGEITFPLKQHEPVIFLLVTPHITPVIMHGNTVNHWEIDKNEPATFYQIKQFTDEQTHTLLWQTSKEPLPPTGAIPLATIILFAHPDTIYVPEGVSIATKSANFILPDIYIKNSSDVTKLISQWLYLAHFFGPIAAKTKQLPKLSIQINQ